MTEVGLNNSSTRDAWIEKVLRQVPSDSRILDAGAGEQPFKKYCSHLNYVAQDFGKYDGKGDGRGLQMGTYDQTKHNIVCDITKIPAPDGSFDAIMCTEVFEHLPEPIEAIKEFSRLLRKGGYLIITAPFCSLTHFAPYHFYSGFSKYFHEMFLRQQGFEILEITANGNFFEYIAQEVRRIQSVSERYSRDRPTRLEKYAIHVILNMLGRFSSKDKGSDELLSYEYLILARKA